MAQRVIGAERRRGWSALLSADHRAAAGSVVSTLLLQVSFVVSGVLAARVLGPEGRGLLALLFLFPTVLFQLGSLGLPVALTYFMASRRDSSFRLARVLALPALLQAVVLTLIHLLIVRILFDGAEASVHLAALLSLATIPSALAAQYGLAVLQGQRRFAAFNAARVLPAVIYSAGVAAVFALGSGSLVSLSACFVGANFLSAVLTCAMGATGVSREAATRVRGSLGELLRFGLKALIGAFSPIQTFRLDQAVVGLLLSPAALGLYVVGLAFTNLPHLLAQGLGAIAYPRIAAATSDESRMRSLGGFSLTTVAAALLVIAPLFWLADAIVPFFFGAQFSEAVPIVRVLLVGALFLSAARVLSDGLRGAGFPGAGSIAEAISWLWLLPALLLLAPTWGPVGVAIALATTHAVTFSVLIGLVYLQRRARGALRSQRVTLFSPVEPDAGPDRLA